MIDRQRDRHKDLESFDFAAKNIIGEPPAASNPSLIILLLVLAEVKSAACLER